MAKATGKPPAPLLKRPTLIPEAAPLRAAFSRLSAARQLGHRAIPQPLAMQDILGYLTTVMGIQDQQVLSFSIDLLQALDSLWLTKIHSRLS